MSRILDYSAGYPGAKAVKDAGYSGVIRYLRKEGSSIVKPITNVEYADMRRNGLEVSFVYQHVSRSRVTEGYLAGRHDAGWALARALEVTGGELPRAIYFAVDYDAPSSDFPAIRQYMLGVADTIGKPRVGTYGKWGLLAYLFSAAAITYGWQTYAWSSGHNKDPKTFHPQATLFQRLEQVKVGGISCDVNDVLKTDYGQTPDPRPVVEPPWARRPSHLHTEDDMVTYFAKGDSTTAMPAPHADIRYGDLVFMIETNVKGEFTRRHIPADEWKAATAAGYSVATVSHSWLDEIPGADGEPVTLFPWEDSGDGPVEDPPVTNEGIKK